MNLERILVRLRQIFLILGTGSGVLGAVLVGASVVAVQPSGLTQVEAGRPECETNPGCDPVRFAGSQQPSAESKEETPASRSVTSLPSLTPEPDESAPESRVTSQAEDRSTAILPAPPPATPLSSSSPITQPATPALSRPVPPTPGKTAVPDTPTGDRLEVSDTLSLSVASPAEGSSSLVAEESYTSTNQVHPRTDVAGPEEADSGVAQSVGCPLTSTASFDLVPFVGPPAGHPDRRHPDLKLDLRGYTVANASLDLVDYIGPAESGAPQLAGLFRPRRGPNFTVALQVNDWIWDPAQCDGNRAGCLGGPLTTWDVTLAGLAANSGEAVYIPARGPEIYGGGYKALVLYAEESRITLGYTREDTVANGYAVHIDNLCLDPNLLALYRSQTDAAGWHVTGHLPALRNNQPVGTAAGSQIFVAIRDRGSFMDPRAKEWWQGY